MGKKKKQTAREIGRSDVSCWEEFKGNVLASAAIPWVWSDMIGSGNAVLVAIRWILWAIPFAFLLRLLYRWLSDYVALRRKRAIALLCLPSLLFAAFAIGSIISHAESTITYLFPGLLMQDSKIRTYTWLFDGSNPFMNVNRKVYNQLGAIKLHDPEIDPRLPIDGVASWFTFPSVGVGHERTVLNFESREIDYVQELEIEQDTPAVFPS